MGFTTEVIHYVDMGFPSPKIRQKEDQIDFESGKLIYFMPECGIPVVKQRMFTAEKKLKKVPDPYTADYVIASKDNFKSLIRNESFHTFSKDQLLKFFSGQSLVRDVIQKFEGEFFTDWNVANNMSVTGLKTRTTVQLIKNLKAVEFMLQNYKDVVISPELVLNSVNKAVMDYGMYRGLSNMLRSKNKPDVKVAIEAISNCNLEESAVYLMLLLNNFGPILTHYDKFVSYKPILKFFNIQHSNQMTLDMGIGKLKSKGLLTKTNSDLLVNAIKGDTISMIEPEKTENFDYEEGLVSDDDLDQEVANSVRESD